MKKIYLFLFFTCFISVYSVEARPIADVLDLTVSNSITTSQYDLEAIINALEDLGFKVEAIETYKDPEVKKCTLTVKGIYDGKEVELIIVIEGMTCTELIKELMKKE
ncbi:hypothetical protein G3570_04285 [Balneolaceae bacterium YR4-1]|uniref:PASTA domain-containing protein n=1 Tax=Halalkalibaculum roseum TaxID=2709311 RepID=A0A6M1SUP9_9BACT|nr:hypothetical protein [Halalkalibaculum roseum]NGP75838.1 hypothetical protein [Halalkalibaculum roseum]